MQKTYWWRIVVVLLSLILLGISYILRHQILFGLCDDIYSTDSYLGCLDKGSQTIGNPLLLLAFALLIVSFLLFFVQDNVFFKWLRFAMIWFILAVICIILAPTYSGGWINFGFTKSFFAFWFGILFVIASSIKLIWDTRKEK